MAKRTDQKTLIRRKAARLFAANGYDATGIQELSEAVGLGRGALYHHIGSKEELLFDIITHSVIGVVEEAEAVQASSMSAEAKVRELSSMTMRTVAAGLPEWTIFFRELGSLRGPRRREALAWRRRYERVWIAVIEQGVRDGEFREMNPVIAKGMLGMHNYAHVWLRPRGKLTPQEISEHFCDLILAGLKTGRDGS